MKRLLTVALLAGGLAAAVPASAAPWCGSAAGVRCTPDNVRFCQVWITATRTCVEMPKP
ncbi:MAG TPA: hypothetical protein VGX28_09555 [Frankiaceae bacterium]|jgi:hypothetical protein|nr:hypothetical protein [Frankiaceae bacterium]